ncbi:MAG: hypothetical protein IPK82_31640 [Polyangiaceae bacterium]|nr:hypothetical protein [Polyangiaceae bacterium]
MIHPCCLGEISAVAPSDSGGRVSTLRSASISAEEKEMFSAAKEAPILAPDEAIESLVVDAARRALESARVSGSQIDRVYGGITLGKHVEPSALYAVHRDLRLRRDTLVAPQGTSFSAFVTGLGLAAEAVRFGAAKYVLVVAGARMSTHVEPESGYAVSIADGAGAVVVGPGDQNQIVDFATDTESALYDATAIDLRGPRITFDLSPRELLATREYGFDGPVALVRAMLARHAIDPSNVALVAHQASRVLMDRWKEQINPGQYIDSFDEHGNATVASIPMTLASKGHEIQKPFIVLMSPGMGMHVSCVLIRR